MCEKGKVLGTRVHYDLNAHKKSVKERHKELNAILKEAAEMGISYGKYMELLDSGHLEEFKAQRKLDRKDGNHIIRRH